MNDDYQKRSDEFWRKSEEEHLRALKRWAESDRDWQRRLEKAPVSVHVMTEEERRAEPRTVFFNVSRMDDPDWMEKLVDSVCAAAVEQLGMARVNELLQRQLKLLARVEELKQGGAAR